MKHLTIGYITSRRFPMIEWFFTSLIQVLPHGVRPKLVIVDLHAGSRQREVPAAVMERCSSVLWIEPKPSVWHGRYRLTAVDFFSASNCRNTVLALAPDGYVALVDDLSVLVPTWFKPIEELMNDPKEWVICGSFQKVRKLIVAPDGAIESYQEYEGGKDTRWHGGDDFVDMACPPEWLFGCSLCGPVEDFIAVNGYPEALCDGMGYEDTAMGQVMARNGSLFKYSRRMKTFESEEHHHNQTATARYDPGKSPEDKSHALVAKIKGMRYFEQDFGGQHKSLGSLRLHMLRGNKFPIRKEPTKEWFTGMSLPKFHLYGKEAIINTKDEGV